MQTKVLLWILGCLLLAVAAPWGAPSAFAVTIGPTTSPTSIKSQTVTGTMDQGAQVQVTSDGAVVGLVSYPGDTTWSVPLTGLLEGSNTITATADSGSPTSATAVIVVDSTVPALSVSTLPNGTVTNSPNLNVAGTATDGGTGIAGVTVNGATATVAADGSFSVPVTLSAGANTITTIATDAAGNNTQDIRTITLDQTVPQITVTVPADNSATNVSPATVSGSVDKSAVVEVAVNGGSPQTPTQINNDFTTQVPLASGTNTITITATDQAGNVGTAKRTVVYDTTSPTIQISDPAQDMVTNQASYLVQGTAGDSLTTTTVAITVDAGQPAAVALATGAFSYSVPFAANKSYQLVATATDAAGNKASATRNITYDNIPPTITQASSTTPAGYYGPGRTIDVSLTFSEPVYSQGLTITLSSGATLSSGVLSAATSFAASYLVAAGQNTPQLDVTSVSGTISDLAGNQNHNPTVLGNNIGNSAVIVIETTPPIATITTKPANPTKNRSGSFSFTVDTAGATAQCSLDGAAYATCTSPFAYDLSAQADGSHTFAVRGVDQAENIGTPDSYSWIIDTTPPTVSAGANKTTNVAFTQTGTASDVSTMTFQWSLVSGPGTITFGSPTALTTTVAASQDGQYVLQLAATDAVGNTAASTMTLTWDTVKPVVSAGTDLVTNSAVTLTGSASDALGLTYQWSQTGGPGTITFGSAQALATTATASADGVYTVAFTATDAAGNSATAQMHLTWEATPPTVAANPANVTLYQNQAFIWTGQASSSLSLPLGYAWSQQSGPTGGAVTFGTPTALTTTISANQDGVYAVRLTVIDTAGNSASSDLTFTWDTTPPAVSAGTGRTTNAPFTQTGQATDTSPKVVAWSQVAGTPGSVSFGSPQALTTTIQAASDGNYIVRLTATDAAGNNASSDVSFTWDTTSPSLSAGPDRIVNAPFTQTGVVSDATGVTLAWSKAFGPGELSFNQPANITTGISASQDGIYIVRLTATDSAGNITTSTMNLVWDTTPPTVSAGPDRIVKAPVTQTATAMDATAMTYLWSKRSGPGTLSFSADSALTTTMTAGADGVYVVRLTAVDAAGNSAYSEMTLTWDTTPPTVSAGPDRIVNARITQTGTASDATAMSYLWTQTSGTGTLTFDTANAMTTTISASADGIYTVRLSAVDAAGNSAYSEMKLTWDTQTPTVSAGPSSAQNSQFTQTGFASGVTALNYQWSQQSGPGTINFGSPQALSTAVTASQEGVYVIRLTATDVAGNVSYGEATITWDLTPPNVIISTLPNGSYTASSTLVINGAVTDQLSGVSRFTINGAIVTLDVNGNFNTSLTLRQGANIVSAVAIDLAGNSVFDTRTVIYDPTVPTVTITTPANDNYKTNQASVTIAGTVNFGSTVAIRITGPGPTQEISNVPVTNGGFSQQLNGLTPGLNTVEIIATSPAGQVGTKSISVTYETTRPVLTVDSPAGDIRPTQDSIIVSGTATDAMTNVTVTIQVGSLSYTPQVVNGSYSQEVPLATKGLLYPLTVIATNEAGSQTTVTRRVIHAAPTGDINGDGNVDIADALIALQIAVGIRQQTDNNLIAGDVGPLVNGVPSPDWKIDISDAVLILRVIVRSLTLPK